MIRTSRRSCRHVLGLTLIEVMVALAVFAVLGTLTYRGTAQLISGSAQIEQSLARWRAIDRAMQIIETGVLQIVAPEPTEGNTRLPALEVWQGSSLSELRLLSLAPGGGVERLGFRHRDDWLDWYQSGDGLARSQEQSERLLDQVNAVRWRFLASEGWSDTWPPPFATAQSLPVAIQVTLDLPDTGPLTRLHALR